MQEKITRGYRKADTYETLSNITMLLSWDNLHIACECAVHVKLVFTCNSCLYFIVIFGVYEFTFFICTRGFVYVCMH